MRQSYVAAAATKTGKGSRNSPDPELGAAYLGVAAGIGELSTVTSTFGLLAVNVVMMVVGAVLTLSLQRALRRRRFEARAARS